MSNDRASVAVYKCRDTFGYWSQLTNSLTGH
jgi:hypothetical protein